jgi:hypothetical protein
MTDRAVRTQDVLDEMVRGIMGVKANKAALLTPVGTETAKLPSLPNDLGAFMSNERLAEAAKQLRANAALFLEVAEGIDVLIGVPAAVEADNAKTAARDQHLLEIASDLRMKDIAAAEAGDKRAAARIEAQSRDEDLTERMARLTTEAQDHAFGKAATPSPTTWTCSTHGDEQLVEHKSPKGRVYAACAVPNCKEFQR